MLNCQAEDYTQEVNILFFPTFLLCPQDASCPGGHPLRFVVFHALPSYALLAWPNVNCILKVDLSVSDLSGGYV